MEVGKLKFNRILIILCALLLMSTVASAASMICNYDLVCDTNETAESCVDCQALQEDLTEEVEEMTGEEVTLEESATITTESENTNSPMFILAKLLVIE